jgi:hypothetical protein
MAHCHPKTFMESPVLRTANAAGTHEWIEMEKSTNAWFGVVDLLE